MAGIGRARLEPGSTERFVRLRSELGVSSFGLNQLNLAPGQRGRIHRHARQEEVYLVIEGELTVEVEGTEPQVLGSGELIRIDPRLKRQLANRGREPLTLVAIGGYGEHEGRDGEAFTGWEQEQGAPPQQVPLPPDLDSDALSA